LTLNHATSSNWTTIKIKMYTIQFPKYDIYEYFQNYLLNRTIHRPLQQHKQDNLSFIIYKNINKVRFTNFHPIHNSENFKNIYVITKDIFLWWKELTFGT
jgi:hypothetical protein